MSGFDKIAYAVTDGRAEILLDRPDVLNAYDDEMLRELDSALERATADDAVRVVVLSGRGRAFCSGVDLEAADEHARTRRTFEEHRARVDSVYRRLHGGTTPTVAAINGPAIGAGFGFALSCDLRVIAADASLRDHHLNVGLAPSVAAGWLLPRLVGASKAREFVLLSEEISAAEAADCGLVREVTEPGETMTAARDVADALREKPATAVRGALDLLNADGSFEDAVRSAAEWQWACRGGDGSDVPGSQAE